MGGNGDFWQKLIEGYGLAGVLTVIFAGTHIQSKRQHGPSMAERIADIERDAENAARLAAANEKRIAQMERHTREILVAVSRIEGKLG